MGQIWVGLSQIGLAGGGVQSTQINNSTLLCITTFTGKQAFSMGTFTASFDMCTIYLNVGTLAVERK